MEPDSPASQQKPSETACPRRSLLRRIFCLGRLHDAMHQLWAVLLILSCIFLYLWVVGIPAEWVLNRLPKAHPPGFRLESETMRVDPFEGIVFEDVRFREAQDKESNLCRASEIILRFNPRDLLKRRFSVSAVNVVGGSLQWPVGHATGGAFLQASNAMAMIAVEKDRLRVMEASALVLGIPWKGSGIFVADDEAREQSDGIELMQMLEASRRLPPWVGRLIQEVQSPRYSSPPSADVTFHIDPRTNQPSRAVVTAAGGRTFVRGGVVESWSIKTRIENARIDFNEVSLSARRGDVKGTGWLDIGSGLAQFDMTSDMPAAQLGRLMPARVMNVVTAAQVQVMGQCKFQMSAGPAPIGILEQSLRGSVDIGRIFVRELWVEHLRGTFQTDTNGLVLPDLILEAGSPGRVGSSAANIRYQWVDKRLEGDLKVRMDPRDARSVLPTNIVELVDRFRFEDSLPVFEGRFTHEPGLFELNGDLHATNYTYRGVFVRSIATTITSGGNKLALDPWRVQRDEGTIEGSLAFDWKEHKTIVDLRSTADANAVVDLVGPGLRKGLTWATFDGPALMAARGEVDLRGGAGTDLYVDIDATNVALLRYTTDVARVRLHVDGHTYRTTNAIIEAYGGRATASVVVSPDERTKHYQLEVKAKLEDADMRRVILAVRPQAEVPEKGGTLSGRIDLTGLLAKGEAKSFKGSGKLRIEDGDLYKIRIFGGLSRYLSAIFPGLGFAAQNDLEGPFTIADGKVETDALMLEGSTLSVMARGTYTFDQKLDFNVEVKPLRKGGVADVVRFITMPVTKLFEFHLGGTLEEPKWRPSNLPKEMFLIFD